MSKKIKYKGKSIEDAISKACQALNLPSNELDIEVVSAGSAGIFGLCKKQAVVSVAVKNRVRSDGKSAGHNVEQKNIVPEASGQNGKAEKLTGDDQHPEVEKTEKKVLEPKKKSPDSEKENAPPARKSTKKMSRPKPPVIDPSPEMVDEVNSVLNKLVELMGFTANLQIKTEPGKISVELISDYSEYIVAGDGQPLEGLQYILRKIIGKKFPEKIIIFLDSAGFRAKRKKELEEKAHKLAEEVKTGGKNRTITSLNPAERRIVHMALQDDKAIRSRSIGEGLFKKILIYSPGKARKRQPRGKAGKKNN